MSGILAAYPEYASTARLDELRATEYSYLDEQKHIYLDYTGAGLAARAQHRAHDARLASDVFGNPHSSNPTSSAATDLVDKTRARVLDHLNASSKDYLVVFTPNATGAARLVGEAYQFRRGARYVLTTDNHNSINGIREFARRSGAKTVYVQGQVPDLRVKTDAVKRALKQPRRGVLGLLPPARPSQRRSGLFAYPAQSNFSGVRHPLSWVTAAQDRGYDVLLDAAAYLPTGTLDLSGPIKPDFVIASWYKLFGYPTGVGCLLIRRDAVARISRPWFAGGTVTEVRVSKPSHRLTADESAFEDGTINFLAIPDVQVGLDWLESIGMPTISTRVRCLTGWTLDRMMKLKHGNGKPMIRLYGPADTKARGGTISFNFLDATGKVVDDRLVAAESAAARISLRTGCFCNPGSAEQALMPDLPKPIPSSDMPFAGAIRISFGVASNTDDVDKFIEFAVKTYQDRVTVMDTPRCREN